MSDETEKESITLAKIAAKQAAWQRAPFWFSCKEVTVNILSILFWLAFWAIVAQCSCSGCIWKR